MPRLQIDFSAVKRLVGLMDALDLIGWRSVSNYGLTLRGPCPIHRSSSTRSRSLAVTGDEWFCHSCRRGGDVCRFWALLHGMSDYDAALDLCARLRLDPPLLRSPTRNGEEAL